MSNPISYDIFYFDIFIIQTYYKKNISPGIQIINNWIDDHELFNSL
jgi:hypothetical protein